MRLLSFLLMVLALLCVGVIATETRLLFYWPGALLLGCAGLVVALRWKMRIHFAPSDGCLLSVLVLVTYVAARCATSPVVSYAREDLFILLGAFVVYVLTCTVASHPRWRLALLWVVIALMAGNLVVGLVQFRGLWSFHVLPQFMRVFEPGRIGGFFNNPNHLAAFLSYAVFLMSGLVLFGRGGVMMKMLLGFAVMAAAMGMALTVSRGGLLALGVGGAVLLALSLWVIWRTQRQLFGRLVMGLLFITLIGGGVLGAVNAEFQARRGKSTQSVTEDVRGLIWQSAMDQHALQPWIGAGSRMFYDYCQMLRPAAMPTFWGDAQFVHNEYLQALADYGWLGLVLIMVMLWAHAGHVLRFLRWFVMEKYPRQGTVLSNTLGFAIGGLAALAAAAAHAVVEFSFHVPATALIGAMVLGLLANPGFDMEVSARFRLPGVRPAMKVLLGAASVVMIAGALWWGPADWHFAKASMAAAQGDSAAVLDELDATLERDPSNAQAYHDRGSMRLGQWKPALPESVRLRLLERARVDLEAAVKLDPTQYLYWVRLTEVHDRLGNEQAGHDAAQHAVRTGPRHEEACMALAMHLHHWGHLREAERAYLWAAHSGRENPNEELRWMDGYFRLLEDARGTP
jgi:O-antigen ligase